MASEGRGHYKIFLGMAAGVGKTYRMLQEGRSEQSLGRDVVIAILETHGRAETFAQAEGLEQLPRRVVRYRDADLEEMDLPAIFRRAPELCLVDELAHTNAPGGEHPKRYEDIEDVLDAGIDVFSTVNVQHLESLNDRVAELTGVRVRETFPDSVLNRADEVVLMDLTPEALIQRLRDGNVYPPERIPTALNSFFKVENLSSLREVALRQVAEEVESRRLVTPAEALGTREEKLFGDAPLAVTERVLALVTPEETSQRLVRRAWRSAQRLGGDLDLLYVAPPGEPPRGEERQRLETLRSLAGILARCAAAGGRLPRGVCIMKADLMRNVFLAPARGWRATSATTRRARMIRCAVADLQRRRPAGDLSRGHADRRRRRSMPSAPASPDRAAGAGADPDRLHRHRHALPAQGLADLARCRHFRSCFGSRLGERFAPVADHDALLAAARRVLSPLWKARASVPPHARRSRTHLVLIPSYNTGPAVVETVRAARAHWSPVWVVVDGSTDGTVERCCRRSRRATPACGCWCCPRTAARAPRCCTACEAARAAGFTPCADHGLRRPASGRPDPARSWQPRSRVPTRWCWAGRCSTPSRRCCACAAAGSRTGGPNLETLCAGIGDSLFGFRVYPIAPLIAVMQRQPWMRRFDFDTEAVVRLAWRGVKPLNIAAPVKYLTAEEGGVSHFRYVRDNVLLTWMHARLLAGVRAAAAAAAGAPDRRQAAVRRGALSLAAQAASANSSGVASRPASGAIRSSTTLPSSDGCSAVRPADDLARERVELGERLAHARAEAGFVEVVGEAAVQLGEPRQRRPGRASTAALRLRASSRPGAQEALHRDVQRLRVRELRRAAARASRCR